MNELIELLGHAYNALVFVLLVIVFAVMWHEADKDKKR